MIDLYMTCDDLSTILEETNVIHVYKSVKHKFSIIHSRATITNMSPQTDVQCNGCGCSETEKIYLYPLYSYLEAVLPDRVFFGPGVKSK